MSEASTSAIVQPKTGSLEMEKWIDNTALAAITKHDDVCLAVDVMPEDLTTKPAHTILLKGDEAKDAELSAVYKDWARDKKSPFPTNVMAIYNVADVYPRYVIIAGSITALAAAKAQGHNISPDAITIPTDESTDPVESTSDSGTVNKPDPVVNISRISKELTPAEASKAAAKDDPNITIKDVSNVTASILTTPASKRSSGVLTPEPTDLDTPLTPVQIIKRFKLVEDSLKQLSTTLLSTQATNNPIPPVSPRTSHLIPTEPEIPPMADILNPNSHETGDEAKPSHIPGYRKIGKGCTHMPDYISPMSELIATTPTDPSVGFSAAYTLLEDMHILQRSITFEVDNPPGGQSNMGHTIAAVTPVTLTQWTGGVTINDVRAIHTATTVAIGVPPPAHIQLVISGASTIGDVEIVLPASVNFGVIPIPDADSRRQMPKVAPYYPVTNPHEFCEIQQLITMQTSVTIQTTRYFKIWLYILSSILQTTIVQSSPVYTAQTIIAGANPATLITNPRNAGQHLAELAWTKEWINALRSGTSDGLFLRQTIGMDHAIVDALGTAPYGVYQYLVDEATPGRRVPNRQYVVIPSSPALVIQEPGGPRNHISFTMDLNIHNGGHNDIINWPPVPPTANEMVILSYTTALQNFESEYWMAGYELALKFIQVRTITPPVPLPPSSFLLNSLVYRDVVELTRPTVAHRVLTPLTYDEAPPITFADAEMLRNNPYTLTLQPHLWIGRMYGYCESLALADRHLTGNALHRVPTDRRTGTNPIFSGSVSQVLGSVSVPSRIDAICIVSQRIMQGVFGITLPIRSERHIWRWARAPAAARASLNWMANTIPFLVTGAGFLDYMAQVPTSLGIPWLTYKLSYRESALTTGTHVSSFSTRAEQGDIFTLAHTFIDAAYVAACNMDSALTPAVVRSTNEYAITKAASANLAMPIPNQPDIMAGGPLNHEFQFTLVDIVAEEPKFKFPVFTVPQNQALLNQAVIRQFMMPESTPGIIWAPAYSHDRWNLPTDRDIATIDMPLLPTAYDDEPAAKRTRGSQAAHRAATELGGVTSAASQVTYNSLSKLGYSGAKTAAEATTSKATFANKADPTSVPSTGASKN